MEYCKEEAENDSRLKVTAADTGWQMGGDPAPDQGFHQRLRRTTGKSFGPGRILDVFIQIK